MLSFDKLTRREGLVNVSATELGKGLQDDKE